jgi:multiple sugar transport system substrate-binding protein
VQGLEAHNIVFAAEGWFLARGPNFFCGIRDETSNLISWRWHAPKTGSWQARGHAEQMIRAILRLLPLFCLLLASSIAHADELRAVIWRSETPRLWEQIAADFERRIPGAKVVLEIGPQSSTQLHDLVTQKLKNKDAKLDVFLMDSIWPAEFASAGWALPLDRYFSAEERKKFLPSAISTNRYRGQIFGVPLFIDAGVLYYRKDLLTKYKLAPPRTWPDLVETAKAILVREQGAQLFGYSGQFKQYEGLVCNMMEYILANSGSLWDEKQMVSAIDAAAAREAVRFVRDRVIGEIAHRGVLAYEEPESLALFTQGKAIFHRNWPYAWKIANDPGNSKIAGKVGLSALPGFPGRKGASALGGWQVGVSRFSQKPDLAWQFVAFVTSPETQKRIALGTGRAPSRTALFDDPEINAAIPQLKDLLETFEQAVPRPATPVYNPLSNVLQRYFSAVLALPNTDISTRAAFAARDMNRILDLARAR